MGVREINERGVVHDGVEYPLDVLIYATGFQWMATSTFNMITGRERPHAAARSGRPRARKTFLGLHSHGFPNLFIVTGPQGGGGSFNFTDAIDDARRLHRVDADRRCASAAHDVVDVREGAGRRVRRALPRGRHRHRAAARLPLLLQRPRRRGARQPRLLRRRPAGTSGASEAQETLEPYVFQA